MRTLLLFLAGICCSSRGFGQYWQQQVNYTIDVSLNDKGKTLDGFETITYINNSPDSLRFIWFHLWPNAYRNDRTAFSEQMLVNGNTRFYFSDEAQRGYINHLQFKVNGVIAKTEDHPSYIDIVKVVLPGPLPPGDSVRVTTPFHEKIPFNFSRGGYDGSSFQITQWYPKPAVYDRTGWHPMPYLDQGEYYSEFGNYDVRITLPEAYKVAATGILESGTNLVDTFRLEMTSPPKTSSATVVKRVLTQKSANLPAYSLPVKMKTMRFTQERVHDFAWFADKKFLIETDTCKLSSGKTVRVSTFYTAAQKTLWAHHSLAYAKEAIRYYSSEVHEYPYETLTVVQGPPSFGGGMEYPTITIISPTASAQSLNETIAHEIGHNWFYGVLATNERDHPWMDEGINTYYEEKYVEAKYGPQPRLLDLIFQGKAVHRTDQPIETRSADFSQLNYQLVAYYKAGRFLKGLESRLGSNLFTEKMKAYYNTWQFKHPYPEDFKNIFLSDRKGDTVLANYFLELNKTGILPDDSLQGTSILSPLAIKSIDKFLKYPTKHALLLTPAAGYNIYDKAMIGGLVTNYALPPSHLQFLLIPLYATGTHQLNGIGKLNYTLHSDGAIRKTDIFLNASRFSMDQITDPAGRTIYMQFLKLVPGFRLTLREKDPRRAVSRFIQWKTYFVTEPAAAPLQDTVTANGDTTVHFRFPQQTRYINQLRFVYGNFRALYPFDMSLQIEQAKDFIRPAFTANYFFNYPKDGGLQVRFFAGKFIYLGGKTLDKAFANDRYFLNLTGPNGNEDYTYQDYFVGRNAFETFPGQQIMMRDGAFKIRTDLLIDKVGKTDNWLTAVNFTSSIPSKINPLSILPIQVPLQVFCDIGTYAERWQAGATESRFLYDAGLQLSLFKGLFNIYVPVVYSQVFRDYLKSYIPAGRFLKTISFSIDLNSRQLKKLNPEIEL